MLGRNGGRCSRRGFLNESAAVLAGAAAFPSIARASALGLGAYPGANDRVNVACVGVGPQGTGLMRNVLGKETARVVAVCDVNRQRAAAAKQLVDATYGDTACAVYGDFRELFARSDIDAVVDATCDHWHVLVALAAVRSGKDVYVEKPLGRTLEEDQALRAAVHRYGRVFQFGTQQRSGREFRQACELVLNGRIGQLRRMKVGAPASTAGGIFPEMPVPDWLDYDLWLGPAPWAPFTENRIVNNYWWHMTDYAVGFVAGWGIHHVDIAQWGNGADATGPVRIEGTGIFPEEGMCDCATSWNIECVYANGVTMSFTDQNQNRMGIVFEGDEGWVYVTRGEIDAHPKALLRSAILPGEIHVRPSADHMGDFLRCVRTREQTACPIDVAVRSDTVCHLSDIAMRVGRPLRWDPVAERFIDDPAADRRLGRAMRAPWTLERSSV